MKNKIWMIAFVVLVIFTVSFITTSYASHVWYNDLRDAYPYGLWIKAIVIDEPTAYTTLEDDIYIAGAIENGTWTWVQQDDYSSQFVNAHFPEYILWVPDGNYYLIHQRFADGIPESWKYLPRPATATALSAIPWAAFICVAVFQKKRKRNVSSPGGP